MIFGRRKMTLDILNEGVDSIEDLLFQLLVLFRGVLIDVRHRFCEKDLAWLTAGAMIALRRSCAWRSRSENMLSMNGLNLMKVYQSDF